jgi:UPF0755 protein
MARKITKSLLLLLFTFLIIVSIIDYVYINKKLSIDDELIVSIKPGMNTNDLSIVLSELNIIQNNFIFKLASTKSGLHNYINAGDYKLEQGDSLEILFTKIRTREETLYQHRIREGARLNEVLREMQLTDNMKFNDASLGNLNMHLEGNNNVLEGLFFPDTYSYTANINAGILLQLSHDKLNDVLTAEWNNRSSKIQINTPYEALIIASIIERESGAKDELSIISGVIHRRLKIGMPLQMDPTVYYGLGKPYSETLSRTDLNTDTDYNTYSRLGLPPSPICLPSEASIIAALHPDDSGALYFVASGLNDGRHQFSASLDDHNEAVKIYRERLLR